MENNQEIKYAGFLVRVLAFIIDGLILSLPIKLVESLFRNDSWITIVLMLILFWGYYSYSIYRWRGTIGKKILGLEVLDIDLESLSLKRASIRFAYSLITYTILFSPKLIVLLFAGAYKPLGYLAFVVVLLPILMMFFNDKNQVLHDYFAKTVVIDMENTVLKQESEESDQTQMPKKKGVIGIIRGVGITIIVVVGAYYIYTFAMFAYVFGSIASSKQKVYDNSFRIEYHPKDYNNSKIIFYKKEIEKSSQEFIDADGMYEIFKADVKKDISLGCIRYFIKREDSDNWLDEGATHRVSARNKYANTEEKIKKAKKNEDYMGRHFYTFDLNMVNHIEDDLTKMWSDKNDSVCEQKLPIDDIYKIFVERYTWQFPSSVCYDKRGKKWFELFQQKQPKLTEKERLEKLQREEEDRIYVEKMEREEKNQKIIEKQNDLWKSAKNGSIYNLSYFKNVNANIRNEKGETPLMVAVKNGHDIVVDMMSKTIVDVWGKDKKGETAFDYIKKPNSMMGKRMYGSLRILEIQQLLRGKAKIVQSGYRNKTDILKISISGASCLDFKFPKNTQCKSR